MTYLGTNFGNQKLMEIARRKPEAVLLVAAGCALLMRSGRRPVDSLTARMSNENRARDGRAHHRARPSDVGEGLNRAAEGISAAATNTTETVSNTAGEFQDRVSNAATRVKDTVTEYADGASQNIAENSDKLMSKAQSSYESTAAALREQPILVAALGLAAGAAVAALFPATDIARRTLGAARDNMADAATKMSENLLSAADAATQKLNEAATERGLNSEGIKDMAREVGGAFRSAAAGKRDEHGSGNSNAQPGEMGSKNVSTTSENQAEAVKNLKPSMGTGNDTKS